MTARELIEELLRTDLDSELYILANDSDGREVALDVTGLGDTGLPSWKSHSIECDKELHFKD